MSQINQNYDSLVNNLGASKNEFSDENSSDSSENDRSEDPVQEAVSNLIMNFTKPLPK